MSKSSFFLITFVTFLVFTTARKVRINLANDSSFSTKNYTKVCDAARFTDLGLDMNEFDYCNSSLDFHSRVKDLIDRMTLYEKVGQLGNKASGALRIGLPQYKWWSEALHGVSDFGDGSTFFDDVVPSATSFPTPILTAASFNETLWNLIGKVRKNSSKSHLYTTFVLSLYIFNIFEYPFDLGSQSLENIL